MNTTPRFIRNVRFSRRHRTNLASDGFTLIELVVVMLTIGMLALLVLPALAATRPNGHALQCLANMKRLQLGAILYANDNGGRIPEDPPLNYGGFLPGGVQQSPPILPAWVGGSMGFNGDGSGDSPAGCSTNVNFLGVNGNTVPGQGTLIGSIGGYVKVASAYKCPADKSLDKRFRVPRVRSVSANMFVGQDISQYSQSSFGLGETAPDGHRYKAFYKYADFTGGMRAADCFQFLEEDRLSINDDYFEYHPNYVNGVNDRPAVNHGNSSSFSFCDGHVELHQWVDAFLTPNGTGSNSKDAQWLAVHGTREAN